MKNRLKMKLDTNNSVSIPESWWIKCPFLKTVDKIVYVGYGNPDKVVVVRKKL
jgi:hypothetical protein